VNDPKWVVAHRYLGLIHIRKREFEQAIAPLKRAIELDPSAADTHMELGAAFAELGRNKEAIEEFRTAIKLGSTHVKDLEMAIQQLEALERSREETEETAP
jgi:Flp pilus assembly protein TadD